VLSELLSGDGADAFRSASVSVWDDWSAAAARRTHICAPRLPSLPYEGARPPRLAGRQPRLSPMSSRPRPEVARTSRQANRVGVVRALHRHLHARDFHLST
jgi:hypothetical protein